MRLQGITFFLFPEHLNSQLNSPVKHQNNLQFQETP